MNKTITFLLGFGLSSVLWFHISTTGQATVGKQMFAQLDRIPSWVLPKTDVANAAEPKPTWVTDSQKLIETWSEVKLTTNEPEHITKGRVLEALRVAYGESGWRNDAIYINNDKGTSKDRGVWQINDFFHPNVSDKCAYNFDCANTEAIKIYKSRGNWGAWAAAKKLNIK